MATTFHDVSVKIFLNRSTLNTNCIVIDKIPFYLFGK